LTRTALADHTALHEAKENEQKGSDLPNKRRRGSGFLQFPEAKGKVVELVEIDPDANAIVILFEDSTALTFEVDTFLTPGSLSVGRIDVLPSNALRRTGGSIVISRLVS
jgi:hypothetical protein